MPSKALQNNLNDANKPIPQTQKAEPNQVKNNAGGFSFVVSDKARLERFLNLGTDGGTFYVNEKDLTKQNVKFLIEMIKNDPMLVLNTTVEISHAGRSYRNSAAIFTIALVYQHASKKFHEAQELEKLALLKDAFLKVVRTSTHLFEFAQYVELLGAESAQAKDLVKGRRKSWSSKDHTGGWGRSKRAAVAAWYNSKTPDSLAYQVVKYRQRDGWTHRDLFRLAHPKGVNQQVGNFILGKPEVSSDPNPTILHGFGLAQAVPAGHWGELSQVLDNHPNLPWEALPTSFHKEAELWKKLFYNGQLQGQALLRNITRLARLKAFDDMVFARDYANKLVDVEMIRKTRLHPIQYLLALVVHTEGQVDRKRYYMRNKDWATSPIIVDALNDGFYKAFKEVEPANKKTLIGLDVSGSMSGLAAGIELSCAQVGAAMSMSVARTEPYYAIHGFANTFKDLGITPNQNLNEVMHQVQRNNFGGTNCSLPMQYAQQNGLDVDTFVVMTDNETWAGRIHPHTALEQYRQFVGHDAKLVVMGMTATNFTIANPNDPGMLDICGADASVPKLVADFSAGRI